MEMPAEKDKNISEHDKCADKEKRIRLVKELD